MKKIHPSLKKRDYLSFTTFRKVGTAVSTPVWFAGDNDTYYIFSAADAGKVKRLKNSPKATVAACDFKGSVDGELVAGQAVILEHQQDIALALAALQTKYGWKMTLTNLLSRLTGKYHKRSYIRFIATL
ncbi:hypothetical protein SIN8267_01602 [Sinobacterium norvegicum]|uniref:Pyridoxamine 5'-phosphate oxidase N-terminal domain-containing protein n=1 Tax=Sinobacterium norvegicum TaxID=1641715 RepID=A0ABN8EN06_9GAMM|nr:PPOX class F420-dependent oxidoreductase [Sinobacterium norvegicum]CAH0991496.1 hypothetical protein SIN8267_01602 [Sinobacterium norvegicum]